MSATLRELHARIDLPTKDGDQFLCFLCPKCRQHEISVYIHAKPHGEFTREFPAEKLGDPPIQIIRRIWQAKQGPDRDWETLTITPSIGREGSNDPCGGWHGTVTDGVCEP